ncbi:MAG: saccharopine dehydrogenase NADP-binding domain-containing protein [Solirubrobacterales bacterium]|nr:saccharopine dehydrogenase NADP-binding domain-containing protein [Solirubrobacterales bacterium]
MPSRIVLFGATGYTGRLTAAALREAGAEPVLAGRNGTALEVLAEELGGRFETRVADVADPDSVRALLAGGEVLISTVGPFARWGAPAVDAAIDAGSAAYMDSTGEPPFIRRVFDEWGPRAEAAGVPLLTALGYDWAPGNLAGALALDEAGAAARRVEIGYFLTGGGMGGMSGGTRASTAGVMLEEGFAFRGGRVVGEIPGRHVKSFDVGGRSRQAVSVGSSEHFTLPPLSPGLTDVEVYLGWFGSLSRPMQVGSFGLAAIGRIGPLKRGLAGLTGRFVKGSTGGPSEAERATGGSYIVARVLGGDGEALSEVRLAGVDGYTFTARFLAWAAVRAAAAGVDGAGALGPASAYGLAEFERGVAAAGIERA